MSPPASRADVEVDPVASAIGRAGMTGITLKQLAAVTSLPPGRVTDRVERLAADRTIARHGRGLWVLSRFAAGRPTPPSFRSPAWFSRAFERQFGVRIGRQSGEIQFSPNEKRPVHRWWPYVQGFSAGFVELTCRRFGIGRGSVVLDPFCGSGTVPVTARSLGALGIGIDMMPVAAFVAAAKSEWEVDPDAFWRSALTVARVRGDPTLARPFLRETDRQFDGAVLRSLLRLKESVWSQDDGAAKTLLKLVFASILIDCSNLKRAPCLGYTHKPGRTGETPYDRFRARAGRVRDDLRLLQRTPGRWGPKPQIHLGSSAVVKLRSGTADLAITSPPYVSGMDYVMNYKIDLAWLDFVRSYEELARLRAAMVACDNIPRSTAAEHAPSDWARSDDWLRSVATSVARNIDAKGAYRRDDMAAIVTKYFDDLVPVVRNVYDALKPGGRFVVVNGDSLIAGTYVPGDMIFARLAVRAGFEVEAFDVARERRSGQHRGFVLRESIATLRKPGPYAPPHAVRAVREPGSPDLPN